MTRRARRDRPARSGRPAEGHHPVCPTRSGSAPLLARAALALYPPSWRARYQDEVLALLDDSGGRLSAVASVAWRALPAWFCPPRHLHDRPARMRASLATALISGAMLAGLGLLFAQLTQFQGATAPGYPVVGWAYAVFDVALAVSALVAGLGGLPLWLLMLRRARRDKRIRDLAYLLLPVVVPVTYLAGLIVTVGLLRSAPGSGPQGISLGWFGIVTLAGFAAAATAATGPGLALRRLQPRGPALRLAAVASGVSAAAMTVAAAAIVVAITGLCLAERHLTGFISPILVIYLAPVVVTATVTAVSAARGTRAALAEP
jgi:hypothetical protein